MRKLVFVLLAAGLAAAQQPAPVSAATEAPPKEVDEALRARVAQFFQAHVDRKFRQAMDVVAEDSQDYFLEMDKPHYFGFTISKITYSDGFTRALVTVVCDTEMNMLPQGKMRVKAPLTTQWKFEDGQWFWFAKPSTERRTPFGMMRAGAPSASGGPSAPPVKMPGAEAAAAVTSRRGITADKTSIVLDPSKPSSDAITLSNTLNGAVGVEVYVVETPGLTGHADKKFIPANGSGRVIFDYTPVGTPTVGKVFVKILPLGPTYRVRVKFESAGPKPEQAAPAPAKPAKPGGDTNAAKDGR